MSMLIALALAAVPRLSLDDVLARNYAARGGLERLHGLKTLRIKSHNEGPRTPRGATFAWEAAQGPRVLPGTYTVRLTRGKAVVEKKLVVERAPTCRASQAELVDRQGVILRVFELLERMAFLTARIERAGAELKARKAQVPAAVAGLDEWVRDAEALRRRVVATKEGGAITGEERLREFAATLYFALMIYEGRPTDEQRRYAATLAEELGDVEAAFAPLAGPRLEALNGSLAGAGAPPVKVLERAEWDAASKRASGGRSPSPERLRERWREGVRAEPDDED